MPVLMKGSELNKVESLCLGTFGSRINVLFKENVYDLKFQNNKAIRIY